MSDIQLHVFDDADSVAKRAAALIAGEARSAIASRGKFMFAVSGGRTPWVMLHALANEPISWNRIHIFQVDERVAPAGDPDRNFTHLRESLLERAPIPADCIHAMPVESPDLNAAARDYSRTLESIAGTPPVLDLVHLGLGPDGHTASLVPGDPVLKISDADVALTGIYQERRRMTLTYPVLNRTRRILWVVTGSDKVPALGSLLKRDESIPAGRVNRANAIILADRAAAAEQSASQKSGT